MMRHQLVGCLSIVCVWIVCVESNPVNEDPPSYCGQLGCDQAGSFTQDGFMLPMKGNMSIAWASHSLMSGGMNSQNMNYGCVGSSKVLACPYHDETGQYSRVLMLNPDTGTEYDHTLNGYATISNTGMAVLTEDNLVFAVNSAQAMLVDPLESYSSIINLPVHYTTGVHSPIYLPGLGFLVVLGNLSETQLIYKIEENPSTGMNSLTLVATFTIPKTGKDCPWLPVTEGTANGNRIFFYGIQRDDSSGVVAVDFMADSPYYKKAWELSDDSFSSAIRMSGGYQATLNCTIVPETDPDYSIFPPVDVNIQLLATPDGYIVITTPVGLLSVKDHGDSGEQVFINLFGAHFLSLDTTPTVLGKAPIVWMTGWGVYPPFRQYAIAFNYSDITSTSDSIWSIELAQSLGEADLNITSRITSFPDPTNSETKLLVFGVSVNTTSVDVPFHKLYCSQCKAGINKMLMAIRSSPITTEKPDILWMARLPSNDWEVKGQIIGIGDKLITFLSDGKSGNIVAFK